MELRCTAHAPLRSLFRPDTKLDLNPLGESARMCLIYVGLAPDVTQAALADTKLPAVEVLYGEGGEGDPELELSDDPAAGTRLDTAAVPVIVTVSKVCRSGRSVYGDGCSPLDSHAIGCMVERRSWMFVQFSRCFGSCVEHLDACSTPVTHTDVVSSSSVRAFS